MGKLTAWFNKLPELNAKLLLGLAIVIGTAVAVKYPDTAWLLVPIVGVLKSPLSNHGDES